MNHITPLRLIIPFKARTGIHRLLSSEILNSMRFYLQYPNTVHNPLFDYWLVIYNLRFCNTKVQVLVYEKNPQLIDLIMTHTTLRHVQVNSPTFSSSFTGGV